MAQLSLRDLHKTQGDRHLPLTELSRLVTQAGVTWVKYPVWYSDEQGEAPFLTAKHGGSCPIPD